MVPSYLNLNYLVPLSAPYFVASVVAWSLAVITTTQSPVVSRIAVSDAGVQELIVTVSFDLAAQIASLVAYSIVFVVGFFILFLPATAPTFGRVYFICLLSDSYFITSPAFPVNVVEPQVAVKLPAGG